MQIPETTGTVEPTVPRHDGAQHRPALVWWAAVADVVVVALFVVTGRGSHEEALSLGGLARTAWPFLGGLIVGWLIVGLLTGGGWHKPLSIGRTGLVVWGSSLIVGMLLREASGQGTALIFVVVAATALGVLFLGWRAIALLISRRGRQRG